MDTNNKELMRRARMAVAQKVREVALRSGSTPRISGQLVDSIITDDDENTAYVLAGRGKAPYAPFVHEGTGIHGPLKRRITPKTKGALAFIAGGQAIVVKSTAGQQANPFLRRAAETAQQEGFTDAAGILSKGVALEITTKLRDK